MKSLELAFVGRSLPGRLNLTLPKNENVFSYLLSGLDGSALSVYLHPLLLLFPSRWCSRSNSSLGIDPLFLRLRRL